MPFFLCCRAALIAPQDEATKKGETAMEHKVLEALKRRQQELRESGEAQMNFTRIILKFGVIRKVLNDIRMVFDTFDVDKSGRMDRNELGVLMRQLNVSLTEQEVGSLFSLVDFNGTNDLTLKQLLVCICVGYVLGVIPDLEEDARQARKSASAAVAAPPPATNPARLSSAQAVAAAGSAAAAASSSASSAVTQPPAVLKPPAVEPTAAQKARRGTFQGKESGIRIAMDLIVYAYLIFDPRCRGHIRKEEVMSTIAEKGDGKGGGGGALLDQERWNEMDWDGNGDLSFEEFVYAFTKWVDIDDESN